LLRGLPSFPDDLPVLDPSTVPDEPDDLFLHWLEDAIATGARQPHALTLITLTEDGTPVSRTLILKDLDEHGYHFATRRTSRKARQLLTDPRCSMHFFWRESGRQIRITGTAQTLSEEICRADWRERPGYDGTPNPDWQVFALTPTAVEFTQASMDRRHVRVRYQRTGGRWDHAENLA
jgi:pyridoxamine 5'-phosphate oxidase